jgi:type IV pilus assembly protein PilM
MNSTSIGLDIGASAVRAAEVSYDGTRRSLRCYAQVGLPPGAVVDGEVVSSPVVSEALRRLWSEGGFSSTKVILGVSGHRVIIRQADVPALDDEDLRSALRFDTQQLIPIPMDEASFDFTVLDRTSGTDDDGRSTARILLVAAHRDLLRSHLGAVKGAGLQASAIDAAPLALMRVVPAPPTGGRGVEALASIGAELTTVAIREDGVPRFIRSLAVGGSKLTAGIANALHVDPAVAERLKRGATTEVSPQLVQARRAISTELRDLAEEVRATLDFFLAQSNGVGVDRLLITGGASQTQGLIEALAGGVRVPVESFDPFETLTLGEVGLDEAQLDQARASAGTAVGLALWPLEPLGSRLSVLPEEEVAARKARRLVSYAGGGLAGLVGVLALASVGQAVAVHNAKAQVHKAQQQVATLQSQVGALQAATAVHGQAEARATLVVTALTGDIDWVRVLGQLAAVMPPNLHLSSFNGARATGASGGSSSSSTSSSGLGTLTFSVTGSGGLPAAAAWLEGLQRDHDLQGTWIQGISVTANGGQVTFSSTANLTTQSQSSRAQAVKP